MCQTILLPRNCKVLKCHYVFHSVFTARQNLRPHQTSSAAWLDVWPTDVDTNSEAYTLFLNEEYDICLPCDKLCEPGSKALAQCKCACPGTIFLSM